MTIFSIFDPQEYNALNNASGDVWKLLEKDQLEKYHPLASTQDAINYFKKIGGDFFDGRFSHFNSETFQHFLLQIIAFLKSKKENVHSFFIKDNKDIVIGITDIIRKQEPTQSENIDTGYYINEKFDILTDSRKVGIFLMSINIEGDIQKYRSFFQTFFQEQMQKNSRNKLNSTLISNVSKELIKQKYIEKQDYRDYLNRDPFQKDKVNSLAK